METTMEFLELKIKYFHVKKEQFLIEQARNS